MYIIYIISHRLYKSLGLAYSIHKLAVYSEVAVVPDVDLVDGNEMLYQVVWLKSGTVQNCFQNFLNAVEKDHDVIVVFHIY